MCELRDKINSVILTGIGNPNVDISISVKDAYFYEKFNIPYNGQTPVSTEDLEMIEKDITRLNLNPPFTPGGCTQNSLRVFQWLMNSKYNSAMIGTVGRDKQASFLKHQLHTEAVLTSYTELESHRTSSVYIFTNGDNRSAVYDPVNGAAAKYFIQHLLGNKCALDFIKNSKVVLLEGFFTYHSPEVGMKVLELCSQANIVTTFNLCGVYVIRKKAKEAVIPFVRSCEVVVGNYEEFIELCQTFNIDYENVERALEKIYSLMMEISKPKNFKIRNMEQYKKILVITNGPDEILCITHLNGVIRYSITPIEKSLIKDTTGAGDAFIAGFIFGLVTEKSILKCLELGNEAAKEIILQLGCTIPKNKIFKEPVP